MLSEIRRDISAKGTTSFFFVLNGKSSNDSYHSGQSGRYCHNLIDKNFPVLLQMPFACQGRSNSYKQPWQNEPPKSSDQPRKTLLNFKDRPVWPLLFTHELRKINWVWITKYTFLFNAHALCIPLYASQFVVRVILCHGGKRAYSNMLGTKVRLEIVIEMCMISSALESFIGFHTG